MRFGPLRPVGLVNPNTGHRPWANVQLRAENKERTLYNIVGFQTNLKWGEQKRVFSMIPGLENAEFVRYGVMPVSYTHLDVYKRQAQGHEELPAAADAQVLVQGIADLVLVYPCLLYTSRCV